MKFLGMKKENSLNIQLDVAYAVLLLASDEVGFITGIELPIDGKYITQ